MKAARRLKIINIYITALILLTSCAKQPQPDTSETTEPFASLSAVPSMSREPTATARQEDAPVPGETEAQPDAAEAQNGKVTIADGFYYYELNDAIKKRITGTSYPAEGSGEITYGDLRYIRLKYYDFDGNAHDDGELIVNAKLAKEVTEIFYRLFVHKYAFSSIRLVDDYGEPGDDNLSMAANNTSAFNYRYVTGTKKLSLHSYGAAIDINPVMNPYIVGNRVAPKNAAAYVDRSQKLPGMIDHDDLCYKLFTQKGWKWGGDNRNEKDYQHFSKKI